MATSISEKTRLWERALKVIEGKINEKKTFDYFFASSYIYEIKGSTIIIVTPETVAKTVMSTKYFNLIESTISDLTEEKYEILIYTEDEIAAEKEKSLERIVNNQDDSSTNSVFFKDARVKDNLTFDNYVVGASNKEAQQAALFVATHKEATFNPLFIYSHPGLGKTHLLCAIGNQVIKSGVPASKILYITASDFVEEAIKFFKAESDGQSLRDYFKNVELLLLDDVQFLAGKVKTEEMFFYIYQDMVNKGKRVVLTSDRQPSELKGLEDRLVSRFKQGLTVEIHDADKDICVGIIKQQVQERGFDYNKIDPRVIEFLANNFSKDVRELTGAINRLIFLAVDTNHVDYISVDIAIEVIGTLKGGNVVLNQLTEQKIIEAVADYYNVTPAEITGKVRTEQIVLARHIAMYLMRKHLDIPLKRIGDLFGGRDHTTVMSGISKVEKELKTNKQLQQAIEELETLIHG